MAGKISQVKLRLNFTNGDRNIRRRILFGLFMRSEGLSLQVTAIFALRLHQPPKVPPRISAMFILTTL